MAAGSLSRTSSTCVGFGTNLYAGLQYTQVGGSEALDCRHVTGQTAHTVQVQRNATFLS
jgi:hypothetical protein